MEYSHPLPAALSRFPALGGGDGYDPDAFREHERPCGDRVTEADADRVVRDAGELAAAVDAAGRDEVVWIPGDATLDVTDLAGLEPAPGVTVASDRGLDGSPGARLLVRDPDEPNERPRPLFRLAGDGSRVTGLCFEAPETDFAEYVWWKEGTAVSVDADDAEVDDCAFRGWGHAGVEVGRSGAVARTHVHHNHFVDNALRQLGYGVTVFHGDPLVQSNYFDDNRHAVACDGFADAAYVARDNLCGPRACGHVFDMHRAEEVSDDAGSQAGRRVDIVDNVVMARTGPDGEPETGIFVRGTPLEGGRIVGNQFAHPPMDDPRGGPGEAMALAVDDVAAAGIRVADNDFDVSEPAPR
ncbi:hypothetical protein ACFO0N_19675 [Halobium salinum]|uniref:Right-handed parallel beta-helix repeat-containing protein n=1 Tax=Halobium salinum TaxID=1364940 RepID=A0ABD5PHI1_9EURY|nr:hypothetical protein [Halobium salinum]